jgi:hypothetical protein
MHLALNKTADRGPARQRAGYLLDALARKARQNGTFAIVEICKGIAIVGIGDMVTADELGELVGIAAQTVRSLNGLEPEA